MRITTNAIMRQYGNRINNALKALNKASERVASGLKYSHSSEAPGDAAKAARLYTQKTRNEHYLTNLRDAQGLLDTMESYMSSIRDTISEISFDGVERALNDPGGKDTRVAVADTIKNLRENILQSLNGSLGNQYLFGGSGTKEPPFTMDADGNVYYRGYDVNDPANETILKELANEKVYVDLGLGLSFDGDKVVPGSAFNKAMPGISFLGYGEDSDGYPKNILTALSALEKELREDNFDNSDGSPARKLWTNLKTQFDAVSSSITQLGVRQMFLENTKDRLETEQYSLEERIKDIVGIESELAITEMQYQQYVYNAILKMGTSILTPSFIDFMK